MSCSPFKIYIPSNVVQYLCHIYWCKKNFNNMKCSEKRVTHVKATLLYSTNINKL